MNLAVLWQNWWWHGIGTVLASSDPVEMQASVEWCYKGCNFSIETLQSSSAVCAMAQQSSRDVYMF